MRSIHVLCVVWVAGICSAQQDIITTVAGGGPNHLPATASGMIPANAAFDASGNLYIVSSQAPSVFVPPLYSRVLKMSTAGTLTVFAGNDSDFFLSPYSGDNGPAVDAGMVPFAVAIDPAGNVFIGDGPPGVGAGDCVIRKVNAKTGIVTTVAGKGKACGFSGDGGPALDAKLRFLAGLAVDASDNVYISDSFDCIVRKVTASTGQIDTVAGIAKLWGYSGDNGPASSAELNEPQALAVDASGNLYIADSSNARIRKIDAATGKITTVAGNGTSGYSGDGGPATSAEIGFLSGLGLDPSGDLFMVDACVIREVNTSGIINTVVGNHASGCGFSGDGGPATSATMDSPQGVVVGKDGALYISDTRNFRVRRAVIGGNINTVAGNGTPDYAGDGHPALDAALNDPLSVAVDTSGNIYISNALFGCCFSASSSNIRQVSASTGIIEQIIGSTQDNLTIGASKVIGDPAGDLYFSDQVNGVVWKYTASTKEVAIYAGVPCGNNPNGCSDYGDGGPATSAGFATPEGLALDGSGNLYIADTFACTIREVTAATGIINRVAGTRENCGFSGDGGPATNAELNLPEDVAVDSLGNFYIADTENQRVRVVDSKGIIGTFAGNGADTPVGDGGPATQAGIFPAKLAVDAANDVLIAGDSSRVRWVDARGIIQTIAGDGTTGFTGDGGLATDAEIGTTAVAVDSSGNLFLSDSDNDRIRKINAIANLNSSAYSVAFGSQKVGTSSTQTITLTGIGPLEISGVSIAGTDGDFKQTNNCPSTLASGESCTVKITFTPCSKSAKTGTLTVKTNGFFNPDVTVKVSGTGS